jgi:hypothetical protein
MRNHCWVTDRFTGIVTRVNRQERELAPRAIAAESLTTVRNGTCLTIIVNELEARLQSCYAMVRRNMEIAKLNKRNYDRDVHVPKFEVGSKDLVRGAVDDHRSQKQHMLGHTRYKG